LPAHPSVAGKDIDLTILHGLGYTAVQAFFLPAHRGKERLQGLVELIDLSGLGPDFDCQRNDLPSLTIYFLDVRVGVKF
jgi:hypothetical protein